MKPDAPADPEEIKQDSEPKSGSKDSKEEKSMGIWSSLKKEPDDFKSSEEDPLIEQTSEEKR